MFRVAYLSNKSIKKSKEVKITNLHIMAIFGGRQKFVNEKNMIQTTTDTYSVCFHLHKILENEYPKAVVARKGSEGCGRRQGGRD